MFYGCGYSKLVGGILLPGVTRFALTSGLYSGTLPACRFWGQFCYPGLCASRSPRAVRCRPSGRFTSIVKILTFQDFYIHACWTQQLINVYQTEIHCNRIYLGNTPHTYLSFFHLYYLNSNLHLEYFYHPDISNIISHTVHIHHLHHMCHFSISSNIQRLSAPWFACRAYNWVEWNACQPGANFEVLTDFYRNIL